MSTPFIGQIIMFAGSFAISGFAACNGQTIPIQQSHALFTLLGTTYGGDGQHAFQLPDLQGRAPVHHGDGSGLSTRYIGQQWGLDQLALGESHLPTHSHGVEYSAGDLTVQTSGASQNAPDSNSYLAGYGQAGNPVQMYTDSTGNEQVINGGFNPDDLTINTAGGGQAFDPSGPRLAINFLIAMQGLFPTRGG
jgi:microcystin-dependent protein